EGIKAVLAGGNLTADGRIDDFVHPVIKANGQITEIALTEVKKFLSRNFPAFPKNLDFSGKADLEISVSGEATQPNVSGTAVLRGANFSHPSAFRPAKRIVGPLKFNNNTLIIEELMMDWGSSSIKLKGTVDDLASFKTNFEYLVSPLDVSDIGEFFLSQTGYKIFGAGDATGKIHGTLEKLVVEGVAKVPSGRFETPISKNSPSTFKFPFTDLNSPFSFSSKVLTISKASAKFFEGVFETSGKVFLAEKPVKFSFDSKLQGVGVQAFLSANTSLKNVLSGNVDVTFQTSGDTTGLDSLEGNSTILMKSGRYQAPPVAAEIFSALNAPNLSSGELKGLTGNFVFKNGKMNSKDLIFKSDSGSISFEGTVGLDTSLSGKALVNLQRDVCQQSQLLKQLIGDQSSLEIPVGVKGSILSPSLDLRIDKMLKKVAERKIKEALIDAVTGKSSSEEAQNASGTSSASLNLPTKSVEKDLKKALEKTINKELGKILGVPPSKIASAPVQETQEPQPVASAPSPAPEPKSPEKQIKQEIKKIGKNLKKLFKF
ncbi:hypothetical protein HYY75_08805, partial [bacterium]|nr:hypothetical protein [bacterium]